MAETFKNLRVPENIIWYSQEAVISDFMDKGCDCCSADCSGIPCSECVLSQSNNKIEALEFIRSVLSVVMLKKMISYYEMVKRILFKANRIRFC